MDMKVTSDHDALVALNRDYIASVQNSDVRRFDEILAKVSPDDPSFPQVIVLCPSPIEAYARLSPHPALYHPVFTNQAFQVFRRNRP